MHVTAERRVPADVMPGEPAGRRGAFRETAVAMAIVALGGIAAHANGLGGVFVFDDLASIRDNPTLDSFLTALTPPANSGVGGRPLANLSFALNQALGGTAVSGYHAVNLALHVASALLLFAVLRRTLSRAPTLVACIAATVWVVHPLTTAAVSYLSQRTELLMGFFLFLTLYAFTRAAARGHAVWWVVSAIACALGMLSKEVMMAAPLLVGLYDRTFLSGSFRSAWRSRRRYYSALAATMLIGALLMFRSELAQRSVGFGLGVSPWEYAQAEARALFTYLKLAFWPAPLVFDYGPVYAGRIWATFASVVGIGFLLFGAARALARRSAGGFLVAAFFLLLAPTSSVVPVAEQPIAENRMYLPLALVIAGAASGAHALFRRRVVAVALALTLVLGLITHARNRTYRSAADLWADSVGKRPQNSRAHFNLGVVLLEAGDPTAAANCFRASIRLRPNDAKAHNSLGNALLLLDRPAEAAAEFAAAVQLSAGFARAWCNYGTASLRNGKPTDAMAQFGRALRLDPTIAEAEQGLGNVHFELGQPAEAIPHYEAATRLAPQLANAYYNAGSACLALGRLEEALRHFSTAARLKPADAEIRNNHGATLLRLGRASEAIVEFERVLRLQPGNADARSNLDLAQAAARK